MTDIVEKLKKGENLSFEESKTLFADLMDGKNSENSIVNLKIDIDIVNNISYLVFKIEDFEYSLQELDDIFNYYKRRTNIDLRKLSKSISDFNDLESDFDSIDIENLKNVDIEKIAKKFKKK